MIFYTQDGGEACAAAKRYLAERGIAFEELRIDASETHFRELYTKYRSMGTPTLAAGDRVLVGFDRERWDREIPHG